MCKEIGECRAIMLTAGADSFASNSANSATKTTSGNDVFRGTAAGDFKSADVIDGGAGSDSIRAIVADDSTTAVTLNPLLTSVENIELSVTTTGTTPKGITFDGTGSTGIEKVSLTSDGKNAVTLDVKGVDVDDSVTLAGGATGKAVTSTVTFNSVTGTADKATLTLKDVVNATVAGIETLTLNTTAAVGTVTAEDATAVVISAGSDSKKTTDIADIAQTTSSAAARLLSLTVNGSGEAVSVGSGTAINFGKGASSVTINNTGVTTVVLADVVNATDSLAVTGSSGKDNIDISAFATGTKATVTTNDGNDKVTITAGIVAVSTGAGDDTLVLKGSYSLTSADSIDLGAGSNDVVQNDAASFGASDKAALSIIKNAEILEATIASAGSTAGVTNGDLAIDAAGLSVFSNFLISGADANATKASGTSGSDGAASVTLTGVENDDQFTISADRTGQAGQSATGSGNNSTGGAAVSVAAKLDGGTNAFNLTLVGGNDSTTGADGIDLVGGAAGTGGSGTSGAVGQAILASEFETVNIKLVDNDADAKATTVAAHVLTGGVTVSTNATIKVTGAGSLDFTGTGGSDVVTGTNVTVDASDLAGLIKVITGSGNDVLKGGSGADTLSGGNGADQILGGAGKDRINGDAGNDIITGGKDADTIDVGTGTDTVIVAAGDSTPTFDATTPTNVVITGFDSVSNFAVGASSTAGDNLDLAGTPVVLGATTGGINGTDYAGTSTDATNNITIKSHSVSKGVITFDDVDTFASALTLTTADLDEVVGYLQANVTGEGETTSFVIGSDSYVFQNNSAGDILVKLVGVTVADLTSATATGGLALA